METVHDLSAGKEVSEDALQIIGELPDKDGKFYTTLNMSLRTLEGAPIFSVLDLHLNDGEMLSDAFRALETEMNSKVYIILMQTFLPIQFVCVVHHDRLLHTYSTSYSVQN